jgi:Ser-tRNA(Ala) deacylase AlaX
MAAAVTKVAVACGELACQKNSYLRTLSASVISCVPKVVAADNKSTSKKAGGKNKGENNVAQSQVQLFEVILDDTVLFPEGGGQPCDKGTVGNLKCIQVENVNGSAVHVLEGGGLELGASVEVVVDWDRRNDHMIQHSTQHLVTAIALKHFGYETLSWNLGESISFLELNTPSFSSEQCDLLEKLSNEAIREVHKNKINIHKLIF